jgi:Flp pilus assembly protein TadG
MIRDPRGQIAIASALLVMILILVAGALVDVYRLQEARDWAYRAAEAAAVSGSATGQDLSTIYTVGQPRLDPGAGYAGAQQTLDAEIARRGAAGVTYQIEVSEWGGDEFAGFPPVARADLWGAGTWQTKEPAVGVYVEMPVTTLLLGLTHQGTVNVHAFAAAGVSTR